MTPRNLIGSASLATLAIATITLALTMPFADASLDAPGAARGADRAHWAALAIAFAVLTCALLMPVLLYAAKALLRFAWAFVKLEIRIALHEMVMWLLLAGAASLGLLHYLEWLPALR
jgi:hypothetical protein